MPEPKIMELRPSSLMRGDWLYLGDEIAVVSGPVDVKQKYVYVPVEGRDRPLRLERNFDQQVSRLVPTAEELAVHQLEVAHHWIRESMLKAAEREETYRAELIESLPIRDVTWHGRRWESYAEAQITARIWRNVVEVAVNRGCGLIEATKLWSAKLTEELLSDVKFGSRSSSDMHNLAKALTLQVHAAWIDELRWRLD